MLELLNRCFPEDLKTENWQNKLKEIIPSYGQSLNENAQLTKSIREMTSKILQLDF